MTQQHERRSHKFSAAALLEAEEAAKRTEAVLQGRPAVKGITIDGPTSKDLDDAFWISRLPEGGYLLSISIADVAALITMQNTPTLDHEAYQRSFTRYYAEHQAPMLPRLLSEAHLSLLEGQPRPTLTISLSFDKQLQVIGEPEIQQTMLTSLKRFHYETVDRDIEQPHTPFASLLQDAFRLAQGLYHQRRLRGALALYDIAAGWATTEEGFLVQLPQGIRHKAHIIIQEWMIHANQAIAFYFSKRGLPALYRNHTAKTIAPERSALLSMMETAVTHPEQVHPDRIGATMGFALERACYAPTVEGHFGLNLPAYLHITSPLRRYPDLVNQRILHAALAREPLPYTKLELATIAMHINTEEATVKDARKAHFLGAYDEHLRDIIQDAERADVSAGRVFAHLDAKQFHSVLRMAAEGQTLQPPVEQEIFRRLEEQMLRVHDLFTLIFRYQTSGESWERVKHAVLTWLQDHPHHAVNLLSIGQQILGWKAPTWEITDSGPPHKKIFQVRATVIIAERSYTSSLHTAWQKELAKQRACAEILAKIAEVKITLTHAADTSIPTSSDTVHTTQTIQKGSPNYKGQLLEIVQKQQWGKPLYQECRRTGPLHAPIFTVEGTITIDGKTYATEGTGTTRALAEQDAARCLLALVPQDLRAEKPVAYKESLLARAQKNAVAVLNDLRQQREVIRSVTYTYKQSGPAHEPTFRCTCEVIALDGKKVKQQTSGKNKKDAAQAAALQVCLALFTEETEQEG
jgi:ribonuclease R